LAADCAKSDNAMARWYYRRKPWWERELGSSESILTHHELAPGPSGG